MTGAEPSREEVISLTNKLAVAEETLRALRAGNVEAIVLPTGHGEQQIYTLETGERPYRHLVERMSEGAALADVDGLIVYANQRLATLLGVPLDRLLGRPFSGWLEESERSPFLGRLATASSGGHTEHTLQRPDGTHVPVQIGVSLTQEPHKVMRCLTVTDLSDQKAQQHQLDQANAELAMANESIRAFAAAAAHDLRSPLASISGFSELLTKSWETFNDVTRRKFVGSIDRQAKNMSRLVDDLLTFASIEGGALNTLPEVIVLAEAISRCLEVGSGDTGSVGVSCSPVLRVWADPHHLARILDNYIQNAFKYGEPPVTIQATQLGDLVQVRVLDHGPVWTIT